MTELLNKSSKVATEQFFFWWVEGIKVLECWSTCNTALVLLVVCVCVCVCVRFFLSFSTRGLSSLCAACKRGLKLHTFPSQWLYLTLHFSKFSFLFRVAIDAGGRCFYSLYYWASFIASSFTLAFVVRLECDVSQHQEISFFTLLLTLFLFSPPRSCFVLFWSILNSYLPLGSFSYWLHSTYTIYIIIWV